jgi:DNA-binding transcriptional ArsR family regulator
LTCPNLVMSTAAPARAVRHTLYIAPARCTAALPGGRRRSVALGLSLHAANPCYRLNHMVQYTRTRFDASFAALSDATRRGVLEQLGRADASITDLAEKFHMTLTGMKKHVGVLEQAGLVTTEKVGRVRTCKLGLRQLEEEAAWIERYRQLWDARFDELEKVVEELKRKEKVDGRKKRE